jgi:hypothetical protein
VTEIAAAIRVSTDVPLLADDLRREEFTYSSGGVIGVQVLSFIAAFGEGCIKMREIKNAGVEL